jgi:hypothetical protein
MSKKRVSGAWVSDNPRIYNTSTDTLRNLPAEIIPDGQPISSVTIKGNMSQSGTPIYPSECGDKTANLFNKSDTGQIFSGTTLANDNQWLYGGGVGKVIRIPCNPRITYTISGTSSSTIFRISLIDSNNVPSKNDTIVTTNDVLKATSVSTQTFTTKANTKYILVQVSAETFNDYINVLMLNTGSTALPYEPYGYKIPVLSGGVTTNIYIGSQPLRKSLDGTNVFDEISSNGTLTRRVDENGDTLATPVVEQITFPTIPTTTGSQQFDIDTNLKPSEVQLTYHGWHKKADKKYIGGLVNKFNKDAIADNIYVTASATRYGVEIPVAAGIYIVSGGTSTFFTKTKINNVYGEALSTETTRILEFNTSGLILLYSDTVNNYNTGKLNLMLVEGSTAPSEYHPYYEWTEN